MKKGFKITTAAALAMSALTPVVAFAAEETLATGYYSDTFTSVESFSKLTSSEKKAFFKENFQKENFIFVVNGQVFDFLGENSEKILNETNEEELIKYAVTLAAYEEAAGVTVGSDGIKDAVEAGDFKVESVSAINKTKVEVKFNQAVEAATKENFTIAGASVNGVELSEDKKTATLDVTGLAYSTDYTVEATGLKVEGTEVAKVTANFTTKAVTEYYTLKLTPTSSTVVANGADNTVVKFELLNAAGEVDKDADNMVLEIGTTFGNLANSRVTVQNGVGQVVLVSEFSTKDVEARVTAQIIEASADYQELIGKVAGETIVKFSPTAAETDPTAVTFQDAESNQADRVTLYFDKDVTPATFVQTNEDGTFKTDAAGTAQLLKTGVEIFVTQNAGPAKTIVGIRSVEGNSKAIEVILAKNEYLNDNAKVTVQAKIGTTDNSKSFTLTDARTPEFTGVTPSGLTKLDLKFSESIASGNFSIDGLWTGSETANTDEFHVVFGEFDAKTGIDKRDTATVTLNKDNTGVQRYFDAGNHSITVTKLSDFAGNTDAANISTTQTLNFSIKSDTAAPTAEVVVESPEQFRVSFNKDVDAVGVTTPADLDALFNDAFKVYDEAAKGWVTIGNHPAFKDQVADGLVSAVTLDKLLTVTEVPNSNDYVVELTADWTRILDVPTDAYYNYQFKLDFAAEAFVNNANGAKSAVLDLNLSYLNSPLTAADNLSPKIDSITAVTNNLSSFNVLMNEPVKLTDGIGGTYDNAGETLALVGQSSLQTVTAEFQGKDKDGKAVVIPATVNTYTDSTDTKFTVSTGATEPTLQALVNDGYDENWKVVVRSISDDVGNTAATLTEDFVVKSQVASTGFQIVSNENSDENGPFTNAVFAYDATGSGNDVLDVTFTKGVNVAGADNLTSVNNWTLNGKLLSNLANVESIKVYDVDNNTKNGYERVVITFADDRAFGATSNVVSVTKGITSLDGTVLTGEYEVVAETIALLAAGPAAPTGIGSTDETAVGANDGTLTGVAAGQEYQLNGTGAWTPITGTTVINLAPGSYTVRVAATATAAAGAESAPVVIAAATADTTPPVITANDESVTLAAFATWTETVSANDNVDGIITGNVVATYFEADGTTSLTDLAAAKVYIDDASTNTTFVIKYNVDDAAGNAATEVSVMITVTP